MKKIFTLVCAAAVLASCNSEPKQETASAPVKDTLATAQVFGDSTVTEDGAVNLTELESRFQGKDSLPIKLSGKIVDVCQKKGCWMEMDLGNNKTIRVTFKDYAFFVPKDAAGKTAIIDGYAYTDTVSVAQLKHYAHDAGKTEKEISEIKEPEISTSFEAKGVIIR